MKDNILYILAHPIDSLRAKARQVEVAIEHASPPVGSTVEEFPELPVHEAARLVRSESKGGVQLRDWPLSVQQEMIKGRTVHPDGRHPEHSNV